MSVRSLQPVLVLVALGGCAATAPESLRPATQLECIAVASDLWWTDTRGIGFDTWEEGLRAGVYRARFQDDRGTFFQGEGRAVWQRTVQKQPQPDAQREAGSRVGGVWLPRDKSLPPKIYYYVQLGSSPAGLEQVAANTVVQTPGASPVAGGIGAGIALGLIEAVIAADNGKIRYFPSITDGAAVAKLKSVSPCSTAPATQ